MNPISDDADTVPVAEAITKATELMFPDPDGPEGNVGTVICANCKEPGWLMGANESGFEIQHPERAFSCRVPR